MVERQRVVGAILRSEDRVLLCHRSPARRWYPGVWDFPGGHVEDVERPVEALRRELIEEIGVDIRTVKGEPVLHRSDADTGLDLTVWLVTDWQGTVENHQPEEHDHVNWFAENELRHLTFADSCYLPLLEQILER